MASPAAQLPDTQEQSEQQKEESALQGLLTSLAAAGRQSSKDRRKTQLLCDFVGLALFVGFLTWQMLTLRNYTSDWPRALFNGRHDQLSESCSDLFWIMHWTVLFCLAGIAANIVSMVCACLQGCLSCVSCCGTFCNSVASFCGVMILIFGVRSEELSACDGLYNCAWWSYIGMLFIGLLRCCCGLCCMGQTLTKELRAVLDALDEFNSQLKDSNEKTPLRPEGTSRPTAV